MSRFSILLLLVIVACSSGEGGSGGEGGGGKWGGGMGGSSIEPATVVELETVQTGGVSDLLLTSALVESEHAANLVPTATGVVLSIHKDEGDVVKRGDLLAVIENVSLDAGAERARAEVTKLEGQATEMEALYARGAVSQREVEDLQYQLQSARTSAREASRSYGKTRLTAPFDGVVASRTVKVGELAGTSSAAFSVVDLDSLRVIASLPERDVARVKVGQSVRLVSAYDEDLFASGQVERVAPVIDAGSGTFRVTIALAQDQNALRPGQFVSVEVEVDRHDDVVVVPRRAVVYEDGNPLVYRKAPRPPEEEKDEEEEEPKASGWGSKAKDEDGEDKPEVKVSPWIAERVALKIGLTDAAFVEILEGVSVGDEIVVIGQSNLRDQSPITTPEMKAADKAEADAKEAEEAANKGEVEENKDGEEG